MKCPFRALAHPSRRELLDRLYAKRGQTLAELTSVLPMTRQGVAKHLTILEAANLVAAHRRGRQKLHYLNPVPLGDIVRRWIGKFDDTRLEALAELKQEIEAKTKKEQGSA